MKKSKICTNCHELFTPEFNASEHCSIKCRDEFHKNYQKKYKKDYQKKHVKYMRKYNEEHKDCIKNGRKKNNNKIKKQVREYWLKHKIKIEKKLAIRYKKDINFRIKECLRARLQLALKGNPKLSTTMNLVDCSIKQLKRHLESKFSKGMSWSNYGKWHIDHIRPCASFDLSKVNEQRKCFHYTNLQPLWARENLSKGMK